MENNMNDSSSQKGLVNELVEGRNLTMQLQKMILSNELKSSCNNVYGQVVQNILAKFEKSLQILHFNPDEQSHYQQSNNDSPFSESPKSQDSHGDFKNSLVHKNDSKKKRKHVVRVTKRVEGCANSGLQGPIEDQFKWRKYGQKDITGAKFPRAYFRCTNRNEGCLATKLVQRSEDDPSSFNVTYLGAHKCSQTSSSSFSSPSIIKNPKPIKIEPPLETLAHPSCQQSKENMLIFQNQNNPFSFSFSSSSNPNLDDNNVCSNSSYCTNINFNDQVFNASTTLEPNSSLIAPIHPNLFDQGDDFDHDFDLNPNFFQ
ncbi:unnamed protein product [Amaranthus hypochondriacus]